MHRILLTLSCLTLLLACAPKQEASPDAASGKTVETLSAEAAAPLLKQRSEIQMLDVRTAGEFASGHIAGARNIDWTGPDFATAVASLDKEKPYFVYCASGRRSSEAVAKMQELGFKRLYNMAGGIQSWQALGYPTQSP